MTIRSYCWRFTSPKSQLPTVIIIADRWVDARALALRILPGVESDDLVTTMLMRSAAEAISPPATILELCWKGSGVGSKQALRMQIRQRDKHGRWGPFVDDRLFAFVAMPRVPPVPPPLPKAAP